MRALVFEMLFSPNIWRSLVVALFTVTTWSDCGQSSSKMTALLVANLFVASFSAPTLRTSLPVVSMPVVSRLTASPEMSLARLSHVAVVLGGAGVTRPQASLLLANTAIETLNGVLYISPLRNEVMKTLFGVVRSSLEPAVYSASVAHCAHSMLQRE